MRRREFITFVGGLLTWPRVARAQQTERMRRLAILMPFPETDSEVQRWLTAFKEGLRQSGWIEGDNIQIDTYWTAPDAASIGKVAAESIDRKPDVISATGPLAVAALRQMTVKIPIVFTGVADPVGSGLVASLARPGGNITGFTLGEFPVGGKMLEMLKQIAPQITRVSVIYNPQQVPQVGRLAAIQTAAPSLGLQVSGANAANADEIKQAIESLGAEPSRGVIVLPTPVTIVNRSLIITLLARHRLPAIYEHAAFAREGGLVSYGPDRPAQMRQAASYVDRILNGANPADLPVQDPTKFTLIINVKTAKVLGLTVPPALLAAADEVIE
jgi:putative tryptophan/tyrosine transport system substrate-binding protein